jgi:hypothetical protein
VEIDELRALVRESNVKIANVARTTSFPGPVPSICECGAQRCRGIAVLPLADFDQMVNEPSQLLVGEAHGFSPGAVVTLTTWLLAARPQA